MTMRWTLLRSLAIAAALLAGVAPAYAHGFAGPGWLHPLTGPDHMLAMLAVGAWSAQVGGRAIWIVPSAFVGAMALGGALGLVGIAVPATEVGIALSVLCLGALIALESRAAIPLAAIAVGLFGVCHGNAHGLEMPGSQSPLVYAVGFLATTAGLHIVGAVLALLVLDRNKGRMALRLGGAATSLAGVAFVLRLVGLPIALA
jgi:urease accessory protein